MNGEDAGEVALRDARPPDRGSCDEVVIWLTDAGHTNCVRVSAGPRLTAYSRVGPVCVDAPDGAPFPTTGVIHESFQAPARRRRARARPGRMLRPEYRAVG